PQEHLLGPTTGRQLSQPFGHTDIGRVEEVRKGKMDEPVNLGRNRADHLLVTVSDGADRDACREVQIAVPVHIPYVASGRVVHDQRIGLRGRRSDVPFILPQEHPGAGPWRSRANMQGSHEYNYSALRASAVRKARVEEGSALHRHLGVAGRHLEEVGRLMVEGDVVKGALPADRKSVV